MTVQQETYKKRIMARFMSKKQLKKFQEEYDKNKVPTINNLKHNAARDDVIRQIVKEEIEKAEEKKFEILKYNPQ